MWVVDKIISIITLIFGVLFFYKTIYTVIGLFTKAKKFEKIDKKYKYAIVVSARNEEKVIGNLIDSVKAQNYDQDKLDVIVVAHNCTDKTAEVCRNKGAIVYEYNNQDERTKGFALKHLFSKVKEEYGFNNWDAYIIFDADNLLRKNYISKINDCYNGEKKVIATYRESKNFDQNFISAAHGLHFLKASFFSNRPRQNLGLSTNVVGTGILVDNRIIEMDDGWPYVEMVEDNLFSMKNLMRGIKIDYCEEAVFLDEQPTTLKMSTRQRVRWGRGILENHTKHTPGMIKSMFTLKGWRTRFSMYDMYMHYFPYSIFILFASFIWPLAKIIVGLFAPHICNPISGLIGLATYVGTLYFSTLLFGALIAIRERKHINCSNWKLAGYVLLWPWFDITGIIINARVIFKKVEWKPIEHKADIKIEDLEK